MICTMCDRPATYCWPGPLCHVHHREVIADMNDDGPEPLGDNDFPGSEGDDDTG